MEAFLKLGSLVPVDGVIPMNSHGVVPVQHSGGHGLADVFFSLALVGKPTVNHVGVRVYRTDGLDRGLSQLGIGLGVGVIPEFRQVWLVPDFPDDAFSFISIGRSLDEVDVSLPVVGIGNPHLVSVGRHASCRAIEPVVVAQDEDGGHSLGRQLVVHVVKQ